MYQSIHSTLVCTKAATTTKKHNKRRTVQLNTEVQILSRKATANQTKSTKSGYYKYTIAGAVV